MNQQAMKDAIQTVLNGIGNNPEAMKALLEAISETNKIAKDSKTKQAKKSCKYIICLERRTVDGNKVYHPFVMTPPTSKNPRMLVVEGAIKAQDMAQQYGMRIRDNVYAMPATDEQIAKLLDLLKKLNKKITDAVKTAAKTLAKLSANIDENKLAEKMLQQMMASCNRTIGSSMNKDSIIINEDVKIIEPTVCVVDDDEEDDWDDEDPCDCCPCCPLR